MVLSIPRIFWAAIKGAGAVCFALLFAVPDVRAQGNPVEHAVKATYLYKFAPFVDWPQKGEPSSEFALCVIGDDAFAGVLEQAVRGQSLDNHPLTVRRLKMLSRDADCRIAFLSGSSSEIAANLAVASEAPILTVTDDASSTRVRGIVNFVIENNRVRFQIDNEAALKSGLAISSKLLSLAVR